MSLTMAKGEGVTVFTLTSDPQSSCPPLCQILKGLCYSPVCCSVSQLLRRVQRTSQSVLGALHIMAGFLVIGFGAILSASGGIGYMDPVFPFWVGALFILFGAMSILSERCPSPCLVVLNVCLNLAGVAVAIAAIVVYSINLSNIWLYWMCNDDYRYDRYRYETTLSPLEKIIMDKCLEGQALTLMLFRSIFVLLIVLSVLEFCVAMSSAVLGIKALCSRETPKNQGMDDPEYHKPLLEEVTSYPVA